MIRPILNNHQTNFQPDKMWLLLFFTCFLSGISYSQNTLTGFFPPLADQFVYLRGFQGFKTYLIDSARTDATGSFTLHFSDQDTGMGLLTLKQGKPLVVSLNDDTIELTGETFETSASLEVTRGRQNQFFSQYAREQPRRERVLSAWAFLEKIYAEDSLFSGHPDPEKAIKKEQTRLKEEEAAFLSSTGEDSYIRWFLPLQKLVGSLSSIAQYRPDEIDPAITSLRALDYTDDRLFRSGLLKDALEGHFWLLENSGKPLELAIREMKISIDVMMEKLILDEEKFNLITNHLFNFLEKRSLFEASEYLALKVLNEESCTLDSDLSNQLESYRKMAIGMEVPDISFETNTYLPPGVNAPSMKKLEATTTLVIFGASWCSHCMEEIPKITRYYPKWKAKNLEVVLVSLDTDPNAFTDFAAPLPFISVCDFKQWDSPIVKEYHVFGTPTYFLLDENHRILVRAKSPEQIDAWVNNKL